MDRKIVLGIVIAAFVLIAGYLFIGSGASVTAQGSSVIEAQPDEVVVNILVQGKGSTAEIAKAQHDKILDELYINLLREGFDRDEIKSSGFNIYPEYEYTPYGGSKEKGFIAQQSIEIKLDDFSKTAEIVDVSVDAGALISYIQLDLSEDKRNEIKAEALKEASLDAKTKAEATAAGLGKRLGRLISVNSQDFNYIPYGVYAKTEGGASMDSNLEARSAAINLEPTDVEVSAYVSVEYSVWGI